MVDGISMANVDAPGALDFIKGPVGSTINVDVMRGGKRISFDLQRVLASHFLKPSSKGRDRLSSSSQEALREVDAIISRSQQWRQLNDSR